MTESSSRRQKKFLGLAALFLGFSIVVYLLLDSIPYAGSGSALLTAYYTVMALALVLFVMIALLMVVCYTNPQVGDRMAKRLPYIKNAWLVPMRHLGLFGAHTDSASDEKTSGNKTHAAKTDAPEISSSG